MNLNPNVLAQLRRVHLQIPTRNRPSVDPPSLIPESARGPRRRMEPEQYEDVSETPQGEDCMGCGRTYPGDVGIDGKLNLAVVEAAAANFWLSNEELKMVQGAAILRSPRDRDLAQNVYQQFGYRDDSQPAAVLQDLLKRVWESMQDAIGPNWTATASGWSCQACGRKEEPGQATAGLAGMNAELHGEERQGDEDEQLNLEELSDSLGLHTDSSQ